ncbi:MAG: PEGA domain-containing protein [bacterium]|nr:PEGA domain-containing protein [bacterium]
MSHRLLDWTRSRVPRQLDLRAPGRRAPALAPVSAIVALATLAAGCGRVAPHYEPATLTVTSTPPGAAVHLDGRDTGLLTPATLAGVTPVRHLVRVDLAEWHADPDSVAIDLSPLETATVDFQLFQTGLRVTSEPAGARILVGGDDTGKVTPAVVAGLSPGTHHVSLTLDTWLCVPASLAVEVEEGLIAEVTTADLRLRSRRTVLLESFGNVNCPTCPQAAANLVAVTGREGFGPDRALFLEFSVNWPSPVDPFYLANPTENADRFMHYFVVGAPAIYVNGRLQTYPLVADSTAADAAGRWATDPGFLVDVEADLAAGASVPVTVTLTPLADVDLTGCVLYVALYENEVDLGAPPGNNGQSVFHHMFRDRVDVPPALGALSAGQPDVRVVSLNRGTVSPGNGTVVAFVQRAADRVVLQAGSSACPVPVTAARLAEDR